MPSSPDTQRDIAERLCGDKVASMVPVQAGGNNRLFHVETAKGARYVLKTYLQENSDTRPRLRVEVDAFAFLRGQGVDCVPTVMGVDEMAGYALYERMKGKPVVNPARADLEAVLNFIRQLKGLSEKEEARSLPLASEACLSGEELLRQVRARFDALQAPARDHAGLSTYLENAFLPMLNTAAKRVEAGYGMLAWNFAEDIPVGQQTLSPSDFGFHNALKVSDGNLAFVDFEYFGWDDPVKLTSDFLLHPAMSLSLGQKQQFCAGTAEIFAADSAYPERLRLLYPLYALRWCMIVLNEFLPERWARRQYASAEATLDQAQERQLQKAVVWLEKARTGLE